MDKFNNNICFHKFPENNQNQFLAIYNCANTLFVQIMDLKSMRQQIADL